MSKPLLMALASFDGAAGTENMCALILKSFAQDYKISLWSIHRCGHFFEALVPQVSRFHSFSKGRFSSVRNALYLTVSIIIQRPAVVMVFEYKMGISLAMALSWLPKKWKPMTIFSHHVQLQSRLDYAPQKEKMRVKTLFKYIDIHTAPSQPVADELLRCLPEVKKEQVRVIPNGINIIDTQNLARAESISVKKDTTYFMCLSALRADKYVGMAIQAFSQLRDAENSILWIAGDGPERNKLETQVKTLGLEKRCIFLGALSNPHPYLSHASLLVHVSERETFGLAALEAMTHGTPVLAMCKDIGGMKTVLQNDVQGILIEGHDVGLLKYHWQRLLAQPKLRHHMAEQGLKRAQVFSSEMMIARLQHLVCTG